MSEYRQYAPPPRDSGLRVYTADSIPREKPKRQDFIKAGDQLWAKDPVEAARNYNHALNHRLHDESSALLLARAGSIVIIPQNREEFFRQAYADAQRHGINGKVLLEIDLLKEWGDRQAAGEDLPIPAEFVSQRILKEGVGQVALEEPGRVVAPLRALVPAELAA